MNAENRKNPVKNWGISLLIGVVLCRIFVPLDFNWGVNK
jgi:hypothetical protein